MNSTFKSKIAKVIVASTAWAALVLSSSLSNAQVVIDDGKVHVINDGTYASDHIEVRNGSTLMVLDGAVISAPISPAYDWDSGLPVLGFSAAAIQVFDDSVLIVEGGVFGGDRLGEPGPNFLDNWYSGSIAAFDHASVTIANGTFGQCAFRSGTTAIFDHANLVVSGGTFTDPGGRNANDLGCQAGGGRIELYDMAKANLIGGMHASTIAAANSSALEISHGMFGRDTGGGRGRVEATESAKVTISGGHFGAAGPFSGLVSAADSSKVSITGGSFGGVGFAAGRINVSGHGDAKIMGGHFEGSSINVETGELKIEGCVFNLPFGKLSDTVVSLQGILANGDTIDVDITRADDPEAIVKVNEDCDF